MSARNPDPTAMTPAEVAQMFGVCRNTVIRWADAGKLPGFRTPGGHRRFRTTEVRALLAAGTTNVAPPPAPVVYPYATPVRPGLTGHTITVERLPEDAATAYYMDRKYIGDLGVFERTDGRFGLVCGVLTDEDPERVEAVARSYAATYGARFVQNGAAR